MTKELRFVFYPEWILIKVGRFSLHHLYRHYSQRPDIHFWAVSLPSHHLWCHPVRRSHHCAALILLWSDLGAEAKVGCRGRERGAVMCKTFESEPLVSHLLQYFQIKPIQRHQEELALTKLDGSVHSQQDVVTFYISVDHLVGV